MPFLRYLINSIYVTGATVIVQLFFSSLAGFALAKYEFVGKKVVMVLMLTTLLDPSAGRHGAALRAACTIWAS